MHILLSERDQLFATFLRKSLEGETYVVDVATSGSESVRMAEAVEYDLIILALGARLSGLEILKRLRKHKKPPPVLVLNQSPRTEDRVKALDLGADDAMTKPFAIHELLARVRALLRRANAQGDLTLSIADLELDRVSHTVRRGQREIGLTSKEFSILEYLMRNTGTPLSRSMILKHAWGMLFDTESNVVDVYINYLRKKVDFGFDRRLIRTVRGVGYQIRDP